MAKESSFGKNLLIKNLRENSPKGEDLFNSNITPVSYKTGNPIIDYYLGYMVKVYDKDNKCIDEYPSIGIPAGCFITIIGKPSTSKTSMVIQWAGEIVRNFDNGTVLHFDLEHAQNNTRIHTLTKIPMTQIQDGKYILRQEKNDINMIKKSIIRIYKEKMDNPDLYKYNTGKKDEFGNEIIAFEPTVVIIDSIATLSTEINENDKKEYVKLEEVTSQTDKMRLAAEISRFFTELLPYIKAANITVITINQIKKSSSIGIIPSPSEILYLDRDEALPGGKAPQFLAHILLKNVAIGSAKYNEEEHGFSGYGLYSKIIKSRTNLNGVMIPLIFDMKRGIDSLRSSIAYAKDLGLIGGNKNKMYFISNKDETFRLTHVHEDFKANRNLYKIMYDNIIPSLKAKLSTIDDEDLDVIEEEMNY